MKFLELRIPPPAVALFVAVLFILYSIVRGIFKGQPHNLNDIQQGSFASANPPPPPAVAGDTTPAAPAP
jgi:hypothetical protein